MPACPSNVTMAPSSLLTSITATCASWGMTIGRLVRVWGQMGVRISAWTAGLRIGPPAAMEYAVEPVGVEMMSPSPRNPVTNWPSMEISNWTMWDNPPLLSATSFSTDAAAICLRSEEHTSELQSPCNLVCRLLLEKKKKKNNQYG